MKEKPAKSFSARNFANVYFTESFQDSAEVLIDIRCRKGYNLFVVFDGFLA